jgi:hypothetical protein
MLDKPFCEMFSELFAEECASRLQGVSWPKGEAKIESDYFMNSQEKVQYHKRDGGIRHTLQRMPLNQVTTVVDHF